MASPVTILTGFLGSGKSTLLNEMLRTREMAGAAVVINEFGEIPIDHLLVASALENKLVLQSGCICCTIRGDLVDTLADLEAGEARGEIPPFDKVLVETTGLADIAPILHTLLYDAALAGRYEVGAVTATVDASNASYQLDRFDEARRQVAFANVAMLTKTDLASRAETDSVRRRVAEINPGIRLMAADHGKADFPALLAAADRPDAAGLGAWLAVDAYAPARRDGRGRAHPHDDGADHDHGDLHLESRHDEGIRSSSMTFDAPLDVARFRRWLLSITSLRGEAILRVKGIVNLRGVPGPVVVQGVRHVLYPPMEMRAWPDEDRRSRIVFITEGLSPAALEATRTYLADAD